MAGCDEVDLSMTGVRRHGAATALGHAYAFVGAHTHPQRLANERDRALQRMLLPLASVVWIVVFHRLMRTEVSSSEIVWSVAAVAYSLAAAAYRSFLTRYPTGGVHLQYAFLVSDPLIVGWALYAAPEPLAWWLVLLLVMIVRVGFRYGLNAMKVELALAWIAALMPLVFSAYWHAQFQMAASLVLMLLCTWWLFAPLNRSLEKAKMLEIEKARIDSLQETLAAKSEFLSRVSHELRSPLQGLLTAVELIEVRFQHDPAQVELTARIRRATTALHTQILDLLTIARGEVGKIEIHPMPFDACELVAGVCKGAEHEAQVKGLELSVSVPAEPVYAVADAGRIDQVLTNLLNNAIRHTRRGRIDLVLIVPNGDARSLRFVVSDTGPGLQPDQVATLFEPFTRFGELAGPNEGTGLGLAVVRSVLDFLGGSVRVESEPGMGTQFYVEIPVELIDAATPRDPQSADQRILVVDDRAEVLQAIGAALTQLGYCYDGASSAATAANLLGAKLYSCALVDLEMPIKSGHDLAAETRRGNGPNARTHLLSMSASDAPRFTSTWPFNGHLSKPISKSTLQRAIEQRAIGATGKRSERAG